VEATIPLPAAGLGVVADYGSVWVSAPLTSSLYRIDPATNALAQTIVLTGQPFNITSGFDSIWTLNDNDGTVQRIDAHTGKLTARIEAPFATSGGAITTGGGRVWANYRGIPVAEIDPATNAFVAKLRGYGIEPNDIAFGGGSIWVAGPLLYRVKIPE